MPKRSVRVGEPPHTVMLSTSTTTVAEETGDPELSMIDRDMSKVSPRLSYCRDRGRPDSQLLGRVTSAVESGEGRSGGEVGYLGVNEISMP